MNRDMMAYCGTYCETCGWKDRTGCKGCGLQEGKLFWGTCMVASCAIGRGLGHCGECADLPCGVLQAAFDNPEHGDDGERLANLKHWKAGMESTLKPREWRKTGSGGQE